MSDTRPRFSRMSEHLVPIAESYGPKIQQLLNQLFDEVMASGSDRPADEVTNDALSLMGHTLVLACVHLTGRMAMEKGVSLRTAYPVVAEDLSVRWRHFMDSLPEMFVSRDEVH